MYRLMIVDDEPIIANSLYQFFLEDTDLELELFRAYSAKEALEIVSKNRIDIVITDIGMPVMNGIELQGEIYARWPRCKFIYLTSHDNIQYAQQAIRGGAFVDFVLKNEEDAVVLEAVTKAIADIESTAANHEMLNEARMQMKQALPFMQKEYLLSVLEGKDEPLRTRADKFANLEIPLNVNLPVLMFMSRVDEYGDKFSASDSDLLHFAIENIVIEYMAHAVHISSIRYDAYTRIWLVQPREADQVFRLNEPNWEGTKRYVYDTLEMIQGACKRLLNSTLSFVMTGTPASWSHLPVRFTKLRMLMAQYGGLARELLLLDTVEVQDDESYQGSAAQQFRHKMKQVTLLEQYLEAGQRDAFMVVFAELIEAEGLSYNYLLEMHTALQMLFISYLNRAQLSHKAAEAMDLHSVFLHSDHKPWNETACQMKRLAELIFDWTADEKRSKVNHIIESVNRYIDEHLTEDLSLTRMAELVFHSPTYFSKLYKKETGVGFNEYVTERRLSQASEMLKTTNLKVNEVALAVGYESAPYFIRAFKKHYKQTPHEYRESHATLRL